MKVRETPIEQRNELDFERIRILYSNLAFGYLGVISSGALLYGVVARYASFEMANTWLLVFAAANTPRALVSIRFNRKIKARVLTPENILPWERYIIGWSAVAYLGLASVIFLPYGENAIVATVLCAFAFMIMATGGVLVLSTSLPAMVSYLTVALMSIVIRFLTLGELLFEVLAAIAFLGYLQLLRLVAEQNRILVENIALKIESVQGSLSDPMTGLANRRMLSTYVGKVLPGSRRSGEPFCLIMLDLDHFKRFNDSRGHSAGDELLVRVADTLRECSRDEDLVVRLGGEEFLVVLPRARIKDAEVIAERIRAAVKERTDVTISAGLAEYRDGIDFDELLNRADKALYRAKSEGRDRYAVHRD